MKVKTFKASTPERVDELFREWVIVYKPSIDSAVKSPCSEINESGGLTVSVLLTVTYK